MWLNVSAQGTTTNKSNTLHLFLCLYLSCSLLPSTRATSLLLYLYTFPLSPRVRFLPNLSSESGNICGAEGNSEMGVQTCLRHCCLEHQGGRWMEPLPAVSVYFQVACCILLLLQRGLSADFIYMKMSLDGRRGAPISSQHPFCTLSPDNLQWSWWHFSGNRCFLFLKCLVLLQDLGLLYVMLLPRKPSLDISENL